MEAIIRRLLIVVTVLGVLSGGFMVWAGQRQVDNATEAYTNATMGVNQRYANCETVKPKLTCVNEQAEGYRNVEWMADAARRTREQCAFLMSGTIDQCDCSEPVQRGSYSEPRLGGVLFLSSRQSAQGNVSERPVICEYPRSA